MNEQEIYKDVLRQEQETIDKINQNKVDLEAIRKYKSYLETKLGIDTLNSNKHSIAYISDLGMKVNVNYNKNATAKEKIKFALRMMGGERSSSDIINQIKQLEGSDKLDFISAIHNSLSKESGKAFIRSGEQGSYKYALNKENISYQFNNIFPNLEDDPF